MFNLVNEPWPKYNMQVCLLHAVCVSQRAEQPRCVASARALRAVFPHPLGCSSQ